MNKYARAGVLMAMTSAGAAAAHHSFAMFDMAKTATITGTVKDFLWRNPHTWLDIYVAAPDGKQKLWGIEMGSPSGLYRAGWRESAIHPGDKITVTMHPLADGRSGGSVIGAVLADGTHVGSSGAPTVRP